jgi:hypothetical protein
MRVVSVVRAISPIHAQGGMEVAAGQLIRFLELEGVPALTITVPPSQRSVVPGECASYAGAGTPMYRQSFD